VRVYVLTHTYLYDSGYTLGAYTTEDLAQAAYATWIASPEGANCLGGDMKIEPCDLDEPAAI